ncbi:MAG: hypothetical protein QXQ94_12105 [Candidatus Bathyarchaeia archaeon]
MKGLYVVVLILLVIGSGLCLLNFVSSHKQTFWEPMEVPYQDLETRENTIGEDHNRNLGGGTFIYWSVYIESGKSVSISWSADGCLYVFVLTENQFQQFKLLGTTTWYTAFGYCNSGTLTKTIENSDTYYIAISNPWVLTTIKLYSAQAKLTWQETVTKYRTDYVLKEVADNSYLYYGLTILGIGIITLVAESTINKYKLSNIKKKTEVESKQT